MRLKILAVLILVAGPLSGCGYKPLEAPCAMNEGGGPAAPAQQREPPPEAVQALSYANVEPRFVPAPFRFDAVDDCGPLRPINAGTLR